MEERELQEMIVRLRQQQLSAEAISQQLAFIQTSISDHEDAITAIKQIKDMKTGGELIVPIGAGSYIYATLSSVDKIILELGSGVSAEKDPDGAVTSLTERKDDLTETYKKMSEALAKSEEEIQRLQSIVQTRVAQSQQHTH
ncbi:MAG: prefoldin subunit alpha [Halobacteriota archaeon]|nr:prefoldin subunit alpha [Halobacteriota archaeon]